MKKQKLVLSSLNLKKVKIARLPQKTGGKYIPSEESACCSRPPMCYHTVTTRPDSLDPAVGADADLI